MAKSKVKDLIAIAEMRAVFEEIANGTAGFFINCTGTTRNNSASDFRLYVVRNNTPRDITGMVARACGCSRNKQGDIRIGGYGTDRYLVLMYYHVGFTLFDDNGITPSAALSSTALSFAGKYYRNTL